MLHYHGGRRLCMKCLEALVPGTSGWTWGFGSCCKCDHFGITVAEEAPQKLAEFLAEQGQQGQLNLD